MIMLYFTIGIMTGFWVIILGYLYWVTESGYEQTIDLEVADS